MCALSGSGTSQIACDSAESRGSQNTLPPRQAHSCFLGVTLLTHSLQYLDTHLVFFPLALLPFALPGQDTFVPPNGSDHDTLLDLKFRLTLYLTS